MKKLCTILTVLLLMSIGVYAAEIATSSGDTVIKLSTNDGTTGMVIQDSDGSQVAKIDSNGGMTAVAPAADDDSTKVPTTAWVQDELEGVSGSVTYATVNEVNTGTETAKAINPDVLAGSVMGTKDVGIVMFDNETDVAPGAAKKGYCWPAGYDGNWDIVDITASVWTTGGTSGATGVKLIRRRDGVSTDITSTDLTITYNEYDASDEVINTSYDDLQAGDWIVPSVTTTCGVAPKGLSITFLARKQ